MRIGPVGIWEILIILVVILLIFGPRRLPEMAKGLGQSVREFRKGIRDMKNEFDGDSEQRSTPSHPERPHDRPEPPRSARTEGETDAPPRTARPEPADDERGPTDEGPRRTDAGA